LALNHEYMELTGSTTAWSNFPTNEFDAFGNDAEDRFFIQYMTEQVVGHAIASSNIL
ncbi:hypothetical protein BDQ17DRAFT_1208536, partial [Cyathus striatus]